MPKRSMRPCKQPGCPALVESGYCHAHAPRAAEEVRDRFKRLDGKKPDHLKKFYSSARWTEASRSHRIKEPLCRRCKKEGRVVCGELTHHNPPLEELLRDGKNPFDDEYLETLCLSHHQKELAAKA